MADIKQTIEFEETVQEFDRELEESGLWGGRLANSNLRTALVDTFSLFLTSNQFMSEASLRESFIQYARRNSSVYAGTIFLGVRIGRRSPAGTTIEVTNKGQSLFTINKWDEFGIGDKTFFSRETRLISPNETIEMNVYEGMVRRKRVQLQGVEFEKILLEEKGFTVADMDLEVITEDKETGSRHVWNKHDKTLFTLSSIDRAYFDITTGDGDVCISFGDGKFGRVPSTKEIVEITYAVTSGIYGNGGLSGQKVTLADKTVYGVTTSNVSGGAGIKSPEYYKQYAPVAHRSQGNLFDFGSWKSQIMLYSGVADCVVQSQRDVAPLDPNWMNVVRVCVLPQYGSWGGKAGANPKSAKWDEFLSWIRSKTYLTVQPYNPQALITDIVVDVALNPGYRKEEWEKRCSLLVQRLFIRNKNTLGKRLSSSDIHDAIKFDAEDENRRRKEIDYVVVREPAEDIIPSSSLEFVQPRNIRVNVFPSERKEIL